MSGTHFVLSSYAVSSTGLLLSPCAIFGTNGSDILVPGERGHVAGQGRHARPRLCSGPTHPHPAFSSRVGAVWTRGSRYGGRLDQVLMRGACGDGTDLGAVCTRYGLGGRVETGLSWGPCGDGADSGAVWSRWSWACAT
eukprot:2150705-Rhodomonas_salina.1